MNNTAIRWALGAVCEALGPRQADRQAEKARTVDGQAPKAGLMVEEVCKQPR